MGREERDGKEALHTLRNLPAGTPARHAAGKPIGWQSMATAGTLRGEVRSVKDERELFEIDPRSICPMRACRAACRCSIGQGSPSLEDVLPVGER